MNYIDMHCDTLTEAFVRGKEDIYSFPEAMVDIKRLRKAGAAAQFFAIYMLSEDSAAEYGVGMPEDDAYIKRLFEILHTTAERYPESIAVARTGEDFENNRKQGKMSAFLTMEDGRAVDGSMERLEHFYEMGIRLISLTWNYGNCFGMPNSADKSIMEQGLTPFGREAVMRMQDMGMMVDVSHLSDGGFRDVSELLKGPFVASHSNCRALSPHPRNLTDEMLRILGNHGGVAGLNFCPAFLHKDITRKDSTLEAMTAHVKHMVDAGGMECAAIGTDFDGISGELEVGSPEELELLFDGLSRAGFTQGEIEKIAYGNVRRVIREVL